MAQSFGGVTFRQPLAGKYESAFSFSTPQKELEYRKNLLRQGYTEEQINQVMPNYTKPANFGEQEVLGTIAETARQRMWLDSPEGMKYQLELAREDAREKAKQTLMWGTLAKLPEQLANAASPFGGPAGAAIAYQGVSNLPSVYSNTLAAFPQMQVPGYNQQFQRYFS